MAERTRCMRCMKEYDGQYDVCPHCGYKRNAVPKNPMHLPEGTMLNDKYILGEVIGQGGFGITYVAFDISLERKVAIKEYFPYGLSTRMTDNPTVYPVTTQEAENNYEYGKQKFIEESRALARFSHKESIVSVSSYFEQNNTVYIVMEYLDGEDLLKHVKDRGGKISLDETLSLIAPVFDALEAIHAVGMIHRDISPDNIFITRDGKTKLLDFGTARFAMGERSKSLSVILTPGYAPPEQYASRGKQGAWTDVYALCATIYRCITGEAPPESIDCVAGEPILTPREKGADISGEQQDMLMKGLAVNAVNRWQDISGLKGLFETRLEPNRTASPQPTMSVREAAHKPSIGAQQIKDETTIIEPFGCKNIEQYAGKVTKKNRKRKLSIIAPVAALVVIVILLFTVIIPSVEHAREQEQEAYVYAAALMSEGKMNEAIPLLMNAYRYQDSADILQRYLADKNAQTVSAGDEHTVGLKSDGSVIAVGNNADGQCDVDSWTDIVAVSAGYRHTVGLKADGSVIAVGDNEYGQCVVDSWTDIAAVSAGGYHTIGLKMDGSVVAVGWNRNGRCDVDDWTDIVAVSAGVSNSVGLKADGSVVAVGYNGYGECAVGGWTDIVAVSAGGAHTIGLKADGSVVAAGHNDYGRCDVDGWTDIVAVSAGGSHTVGLKADGSVVATGNSGYGRCDVDGWKDIVAVSAGGGYTVGLKSDGSVVAVGYNDDGQSDVDGWTDIMLPSSIE